MKTFYIHLGIEILDFIYLYYTDSLDKYEPSFRHLFIKTFPEILQCDKAILIETISSGEKNSYENILVNYDKIDSVCFEYFECTWEGWKRKSKSVGKYFFINSDFEKYRRSIGSNYPEVILTLFNCGLPVKSSYFIQFSLATDRFNGLLFTWPSE